MEVDEIEAIEDEPQGKRSYLRFQYSMEALAEAIKEVKGGKISANKAAKMYGIPKGTLIKKLRSNEPLKRKMGPSPVLNAEEEIRIKHWILGKAEIGFPMHPEEVLDAVQKLMQETRRDNPFKNDRPGMKWLKLFMKRHPEITKKNAEIISKARASVTEEKIKDWFKGLEGYLQSEGAEDILQDPARILNLDETGASTCPNTGKVLGPKHYKNFYEIAPGPEKECITVLCTYSADGNTLPPMIVYAYKRIPRDILESVPSPFTIGRSDSGWMVSPTFFEYIANILEPALVKAQVKFPVLLLLDGHKSHINEELFKFCREKKIFIYCLLPNATHILQPCDVAIFRPLKVAWRKEVRKHKQSSSKPISKLNFAPLFNRAFQAVTKETVKNGFKACGLFPFDPNSVDYNKCISSRRKGLLEISKSDVSETRQSDKPDDYKKALRVIEEVIGTETTQFFKEVSNKRGTPADPKQTLLYSVWKTISGTSLNLSATDSIGGDIQETTRQTRPKETKQHELNKYLSEIDKPTETDEPTETNKTTETDKPTETDEPTETNKTTETDKPTLTDKLTKSDNPPETGNPSPKETSLINKPSSSDQGDPWAKHLHWPRPPEKRPRRAQEQMPYAITSDMWKLYNDKKIAIKKEKEEGVKKRKTERENKKEREDMERNKKKEDRRNFEEWIEKKNEETRRKLQKFQCK